MVGGRKLSPSDSPLTAAPFFYIRTLLQLALAKGMNDAGFRASESAVNVCRAARAQIDYVSVHSPAMTVLYDVIGAYLSQQRLELVVVVLKHWNTLLADVLIRNHYQIRDIFRDSFTRIAEIARRAIAIEQVQGIFGMGLSLPPYNRDEVGSFADLVRVAVLEVERAVEDDNQTYAWEALEELIDHSQKISQIDFGASLLRWHVIESFGAAAMYLLRALPNPKLPRGVADILSLMRQLMRAISSVSTSTEKNRSPWSERGASMIAALAIDSYVIPAPKIVEDALALLEQMASDEFKRSLKEPWISADILKRIEQIRRVAAKRRDENNARRAAEMLAQVGSKYSVKTDEIVKDRIESLFERDRVGRFSGIDPATAAYKRMMPLE